jgi:hypothetical protein
MCLLIHKPKGIALPEQLLESAADYNPHGYGFISFNEAGELQIRRNATTSSTELRALYAEFGAADCVIHLRYGTSGLADYENTHPLRITDDIYLAHNGTLNLQRHASGRSDTWHLVHDYLGPILTKRPELLHDQFFHELVINWCGIHNKFIFIDRRTRQMVIVNREAGFELNGLWLSNTRWFDASRFNWHPARSLAALSGPQPVFST